MNEKKITVFTDGSFSPNEGNCHGGGLYILPTKEVKPFAVMTTLHDWTKMRNIGGEILAAFIAIRSIADICKSEPNTLHYVKFIYDYEGVEKWVTQEWRAKNKFTKWYSNVMRSLIFSPDYRLVVEWEHTYGHTGNTGNELADRIASFDMQFCKSNNIEVINLDEFLEGSVK